VGGPFFVAPQKGLMNPLREMCYEEFGRLRFLDFFPAIDQYSEDHEGGVEAGIFGTKLLNAHTHAGWKYRVTKLDLQGQGARESIHLAFSFTN